MQDLVQSGGWMMLPILISSVVALAIVGERFWTLCPNKLAPPGTLPQVRGWLKKGQLNAQRGLLSCFSHFELFLKIVRVLLAF